MLHCLQRSCKHSFIKKAEMSLCTKNMSEGKVVGLESTKGLLGRRRNMSGEEETSRLLRYQQGSQRLAFVDLRCSAGMRR